MRYYTKNILFYSLIICTFFLLTSCSSEKKDHPTVGIIIHDYNDPFLTLVRKSIEIHLPANIIYTSVDSKEDPYLQILQVEDFIKKDVNAIILNSVEMQDFSEIINKVKKADIPLILFNRKPNIESIKEYSKAIYIGLDIKKSGVLQGNLIKRVWDKLSATDKNKKTLNYVVLQGSIENKSGLLRTDSAIAYAQSLGVPMKQARQTYYCNWERALAREATSSLIEKGLSDIDIIIASNDAIALGAIDALEKVNYNTGATNANFIPIIGFDALPEAINAIRKKRMTGTVFQDPDDFGRVIAQVVNNMIEGKDFVEGTGYEWDEIGPCIFIEPKTVE